MRLKVVYALATLVVVWMLFQVFFRYEYVTSGGGVYGVWRIDRLTGASCLITQCDYYWSFGSRPASGPSPSE